MYHSVANRIVTIFTAAGLLTAANCLVPPFAQSSTLPKKGEKTSSVYEQRLEERVLQYPLPPQNKELKQEPTTVEIYQYDNEPLGSRNPIVFVHGLNGEGFYQFRWNKVVAFLTSNPDFNSKYKVFFFRYNTRAPLDTVRPLFKTAIRNLSESTSKHPITLVALSLGGNIVQESMEDADVASAVDTVMAMGTPFHGSPLFCFDWMKYSMLKNNLMPWARLDNVIPYKMYFDRHTNLLADLRWDDSDSRIPDVGPFKSVFPWRFKGTLTPQNMNNPRIVEINEKIKVDKSKFITYGGYLLTDYSADKQPNYVWSMVKLPYRFMTTTVPEHMAREHPVLRCLNDRIARAVPRKIGDDAADNRFIYSLNDGITPLASALFLPSRALSDNTFNNEADVRKIGPYVDVRRARIFRNIDHLTYIDGYRPFGASQKLKDELAPDEDSRTIFNWILADLVGAANDELAKSKGTAKPLQTGVAPVKTHEASIETITDSAVRTVSD
jgi:pimeloyl-ACP methyl ester carboxylesterase